MQDSSTSWVAFLRGVNLGKRQVKSADLKQAMEGCGFTNVRTVLASGNAVFDAPKPVSAAGLEACLQAAFGFSIDVILRSAAQIRSLVNADPFAGVAITPDTRLYVSFLPAEPRWLHPLPYDFPGGHFRLLRTSGGDLCSVITISADLKTPDAMTVLEKEFGKKITTRNWNTVLKILAVC